MNLNPPIPRLERLRPRGPGHPAPEREDPTRPPDRTTANRTPVKSRTGAVRRERHQADYVILVVVVALTAIGILMVYSSSALKGYLSQNADTFATVGPQIQWAILGEFDHKNLSELPLFTQSNPTSEKIAKVIFEKISDKINTNYVKVFKVRVSESPGSGASYFLADQ